MFSMDKCQLFLWPFSIAMLNYQRVSIVDYSFPHRARKRKKTQIPLGESRLFFYRRATKKYDMTWSQRRMFSNESSFDHHEM